MLRPTIEPLRPAADSQQPPGDYFLSNVRLEIPNADTAVFHAILHGPAGAQVRARAWLSTEADGTLAETASPALKTGESVSLTVTLRDARVPECGWIRIESSPLETRHVVGIKIPKT